jgi:uncharacterized membrane protein YjfL (UPF0719 family)
MDFINPQFLINSLIFSILGVIVFSLAFVIIDKLTPSVNLLKEICEKQNLAVAIVVAAMCLGIANIVAASIHG